MDKKKRFFEGPEIVLRFTNLYTEPPIKIGSFEIPWIAMTGFVYISLILTYVPSIMNCVLNVSDFISLLPAILVMSSNFGITTIYGFCLSNRRFIIDSINTLDEYVWKRKKSKPYNSAADFQKIE